MTALKTTPHRAKALSVRVGILNPDIATMSAGELRNLAKDYLACLEFIDGVVESCAPEEWSHEKALDLLGREPSDEEANVRARMKEHDEYAKEVQGE